MERFVFNARRWPRVPARCRVAVTNRGIQWAAETEDVGPGGCQLVSPRVIAAGGEVRLAIATQALVERLSILGRVAWTSAEPPIRLGIAFAQQLANIDPRAWFERLLQADPAVAAAIRRLPDRLPVSTVLYLGQPPRFVIDFTADELAILRLVGEGTRISEILSAAGIYSAATSRAIFSLLARRALVLSRAEAVPAARWAGTLARADAAQHAERPDPSSAFSATPIEGGGVVDPFSRPRQEPPPLPGASSGGSPRSRMDAREELAGKSTVAPESRTASPGAPKVRRSSEAQALLEAAQRQIAAGGVSAAIVLLRRALALSHGDMEISALLGQLAFKDRNR